MPPSQQIYPQYTGAPQMPTPSPKRHSFGLIISLILFILLFLGAGVFGLWAYGERTDYKENSDKKAQAFADAEIKKASEKQEAVFAEKEKNPLKKYKGPGEFGGLDISYPKTWSAFITENNKGSLPIDGYLHPNFVPGTQSGTLFALRVQVTNQTYEQELRQFDSKATTGKVRVAPYVPANVPNAKAGSRIDGEIGQGQNGSMILLPLRDKTIKIFTESQQFMNDFNNIILANLKYSP